MAATKRNAMLIDEARGKIRTTQLINRLQDHIDGKCEMSQTQITAIRILLGKSIPDLQAVEHTGEIQHNHIARLPSPSQEIDQWRDQQQSALPRPLTQ